MEQIAKSDYSSKMNDIAKQHAVLSEKEVRIQEKKEENGELFDRLNQVIHHHFRTRQKSEKKFL